MTSEGCRPNYRVASLVVYVDARGVVLLRSASYRKTLKSPTHDTMHLTPKEQDKLMLLTVGMIAERRLQKGLKLNYPEAVAYITSAALEGAREGKTVEEVMHDAAQVLTRDQVMPGVPDMITLLQVEAVFTDGSRLVSIHHPIK